MLSHWECYALAVAGVLGFVVQQVSLGTGRLAPSVATVSVANPIVAILIGIVLLDERLSRPAWHVLVAVAGLGLTFVGAVVISLAREVARPDRVASMGASAEAGLAAMAECGAGHSGQRALLRPESPIG